MHLTWQAGDPVVQLNFPNPLNVSVQVGDVAYFSNPTPVGQAQPWTATTTPHLSNPQSGIIMIGEIIQIIPWNGTVSSIICNMPQALFNQYFAQIVAGGCILGPLMPMVAPLNTHFIGILIIQIHQFTISCGTAHMNILMLGTIYVRLIH